ncbi:MAG: hypothetical protein JW776_00775 [Candidatus Lokiarchaeota archaeon]|nr:hypothetical protein [Candidatus Lokiarchaeota archaeon]
MIKIAIYETGILVDGNILIEKKYYDASNALDNQLRAGLLAAVDGFAHDAFNSTLESFTLSSYTLVAISKILEIPVIPEESVKSHTLMIFTIIEKDTNERAVKVCMQKALDQFLNRYSVNDILTKDSKYFMKFTGRFDKIFKDLILKSEDRFSSMF